MAYPPSTWRQRSSSTRRVWEKSTYIPPPEPPLGPLLSTIQKDDLVAGSEKYIPLACITECEYVASFNWRDSRTPSVFVPGKPPRWTPTSQPRRLPPDRSECPRDRNGYHFPKHPFEATALSVLATHPEGPRSSLDIVCSASSLGHLISFCIGNDDDFRGFRALVEVIGGTVHIFRRDNAPDMLISGVKGYGHTFPEANTTWDVETAGSTSHQRITRYNLGGLNILLRAEIDGYLPESSTGEKTLSRNVAFDQLLDGLASSSVSPKAIDTGTSILTVKEAGSPVSQSSIFDLKTRSELRRDDDILSQQLPRLWRSQIPNFILAFHDRGTFRDVRVHNVRDRIEDWEKKNTKGIAVLITLLRQIMEVVTSSPTQKVEIRATLDSEIEVREQLSDTGEAISPAVRKKWEDWLGNARRGSTASPAPAPAKDESEFERHGWCSSEDEESSGYSDYAIAESPEDFTACSADSCGYCGRCSY